MSRIDLSAQGVSRRIARASGLSDLTASKRLEGKLDMSAAGVSRRLREVCDLLQLCRRIEARPKDAPAQSPRGS